MKKIAFIIPGYTHTTNLPEYQKLKILFKNAGFEVKLFDTEWKHRIMSDYVADFEKFYTKNKGEENAVLGFSFGAMIACVSAATDSPDYLFLCSMSPYFIEDVATFKNKQQIGWLKFLGKHRTEDFKTLSFANISEAITSKTYIFLGEKEEQRYPVMINKSKMAEKMIADSTLVMVKKAKHDIGLVEYQTAIQTAINKLA